MLKAAGEKKKKGLLQRLLPGFSVSVLGMAI
jgi:hypothetical protein